MNSRQKRAQDLEKHILEADALLQVMRKRLLTASDPRERSRLNDDIQQMVKDRDSLDAELAKLTNTVAPASANFISTSANVAANLISATGPVQANKLPLVDREYLHSFLLEHFNLPELKTLAFAVGINYDTLPHATSPEFCRELIAYCERKQLVSELLQQAQAQRPDERLDTMCRALANPAPIEAAPPTLVTPMPERSPFVVAGRLEKATDLVGRARERQTLTDRSYKGLSTSLVGARRIGKTWLLDWLRLVAPHELGSRHRVAYIDASLDSCRNVAGFVTVCLRELGLPVDGQPAALTLTALENGVRSLRANNHVPVLCLDEFERFGRANQHEFDLNFFEGMRAIAGLGAAIITASKTPLMELVNQISDTSPFFNIFETVRVQPFASRESQLFINKFSASAAFDSFEQAKLLELGHDPHAPGKYPPLRLQLVGNMLYQEKYPRYPEEVEPYLPTDPAYWQEFGERLDDKYYGMVPR